MNRTGAQIQKLLDTHLYSAIGGIITKTDSFDTQLVHILSFITRNKKRKPYSIDREEAISILCKSLVTDSPEEKIELVKSLGLERNILQVFVLNFLESYYDEFMYLYYSFLTDKKKRKVHRSRLKALIQSVGCESRSDMYQLLQDAKYYIVQYQKAFSDTVQEYLKLCLSQAKSFVKSKTGHFDRGDVYQRMLRNVVVGINKYDSSKGALTSYIRWWIMNASTCQSTEYEYGIAYSLPQNAKKKVVGGNHTHTNFSVSLDSLQTSMEDDDGSMHDVLADSSVGIERALESDTSLKVLSVLFKRVDSEGLGRLVLEAPEHFTVRERRKMVRHMRKQNLHKHPVYKKSVKILKNKLS